MMYSNDPQWFPESELSKTLNRLETCLSICISDMKTQLGFQLMCGALNEECSELLNELEKKADKYKMKIPIYREEPLNLDWQVISRKIKCQIDDLYSHEFFVMTSLYGFNYCLPQSNTVPDECAEKDTTPTSMCPPPIVLPILLISKLQKIADLLVEIDETLCNYTDGNLYTQYCMSELDYYDKTGFNRHKRELNQKLNMQKSKKFEQFCQYERTKIIKELLSINEDFADENEIIDLESIGRFIWGKHNNHENDPLKKDGTPYTITDILQMVKSADHYESRANGTDVRITDGNMLKVLDYIAPMAYYTTPSWKLLHKKLWTYLLANESLTPLFSYKATSRAEFTWFDLPFVHNVICTLQENFSVYVPFDNKNGHPSIMKLNKELVFEGKGDIGAHRTALKKAVENDNILKLIKEAVNRIRQTPTP